MLNVLLPSLARHPVAVTGNLYALLTDLGGPAFSAVIAARRARGREHPARHRERFGVASRSRPAGSLAWVHAASVGEVTSAIPLVEALLERDRRLHVLVTTGTVTSAAVLAGRLPARAFHQFVPLDRRAWVRRFLDHWRPDLAVWVESELWPNLILEARRRAIPMALVNARMSDRSFRRWSLAPQWAALLLRGFEVVLPQGESHADRLRRLGATRMECVGNLKFAAPPLPADVAGLAKLRAEIGARPVWLAASTHEGEDAIVAGLHQRLAQGWPDLLTILAPRHPHRREAVAALLAGYGLRFALRSRQDPIRQDTPVYLTDTVGELGLLYRVAPLSFLGGSLVAHGGHNPIEPARLDCAVLTGPHIGNFAEIYLRFRRAGGVTVVEDGSALGEAIAAMLRDPAARALQSGAAARVVAEEAGVLAAVMAQLDPLLPDRQERTLAPT